MNPIIDKAKKHFSALGTGDFAIYLSYREMLATFGEPDEKEKSQGYPDECIWYGSFFNEYYFTIHNQALRNNPSPERNRAWVVHCGYTSITMKMLRFLTDGDRHGFMKFIFTEYEKNK